MFVPLAPAAVAAGEDVGIYLFYYQKQLLHYVMFVLSKCSLNGITTLYIVNTVFCSLRITSIYKYARFLSKCSRIGIISHLINLMFCSLRMYVCVRLKLLRLSLFNVL